MESGRPTKRLKLSTLDYFDDPSNEVNWSDIERAVTSSEGEDAELGWIMGNVFMVFLSRHKSEIQIRSAGKLQFKISITCPEYHLFRFAIGQSIKVSLRAARVVRFKTGTSSPGYMPFSLIFRDGAAVKFIAGGKFVEDGTVVDSWHGKYDNDVVQGADEWYLSSPIKDTSEQPRSTTRDASERPASSSPHSTPSPETPGSNKEHEPLESSVVISNGDDHDEDLAKDIDVQNLEQNMVIMNKTASSPVNKSDASAPSTSKHEGKKKKRDILHHRSRVRPSASSADSREPGSTDEPTTSRAEKKRRKRVQASPDPPKRSPALDLVAGISAENGAYPALEIIRANTTTQVIGVVVSAEAPEVTRKGDFKVSIMLVDPSQFQGGSGFKVTCFMKSGFQHILPSPDNGHVLLLRDVKAAEWNKHINGTVYAERLKWVAYNPDTDKLYHSEDTNRGPQSSFFPGSNASYQPTESEVRYMVKLTEWWRAVKEEQERGAIQIEDYSRQRREHRLIGSCRANEFFNATVEILRVEEADSGQTTLIFSDYTPHPERSSDGYYGQWAIHATTNKIEAELLDTMKTGTYWSINNMRLKFGSTHYLEADLYDARMHELDSDEDDAYLRELLVRKEAYLRDHPQNPEQGDAVETLISDIAEPGHYNIIAELLYRTNARDAVTDLYVSDYTDNALLWSFQPGGLKRQLNGSSVTVLQIGAWDGHELVRDMDIGCVYSFTDVRVMKHHDGGLKGNLKFADKRITRMNVRKTDNAAVLALLQRKKEYPVPDPSVRGNDAPSPIMPSECRPTPAVIPSNAIKSRHTDQPQSTIDEILSTVTCPNKFRLIARIADFYPYDITDFTTRKCTNCNQRISDNHNACLKCEDFMAEYVEWVFNFYLLLEDENGDLLPVDAYNEAKYFMRGLQPCDLKENSDALCAVKRRLQACLGNLVEVHEGLEKGEEVEAYLGPYFDLAVKSWEVSSGDESEVVFSLTGCEVVDPPT